jgi:hypothetical protein
MADEQERPRTLLSSLAFLRAIAALAACTYFLYRIVWQPSPTPGQVHLNGLAAGLAGFFWLYMLVISMLQFMTGLFLSSLAEGRQLVLPGLMILFVLFLDASQLMEGIKQTWPGTFPLLVLDVGLVFALLWRGSNRDIAQHEVILRTSES